MRKTLVIAFVAVALCGASAARAQDAELTDMQALKTAAGADKKALVKATLDLTEAEAKRFWPLYDTYQRRLEASNKRRTKALEGVVALDKPASNLFAKKLADELTAADEDEMRARRALHNGVVKALPSKKAARYLQLEAKIRSMQAYDMASAFPLVK